ncbi:MAG: DUF4363 family protein [Clostridiales bacterium]|nr:DUF4363 family protein [Clostridiales bacterium]
MKKRLIISIILLSLSAGITSVSYGLITQRIGKLRDALCDALYTYNETGEISSASLSSATEKWEEYRPSFCVFLNGNDVSDAEREMKNIVIYSKRHDGEKFFEACVKCISVLDDAEKKTRLNAENIL